MLPPPPPFYVSFYLYLNLCFGLPDLLFICLCCILVCVLAFLNFYLSTYAIFLYSSLLIWLRIWFIWDSILTFFSLFSQAYLLLSSHSSLCRIACLCSLFVISLRYSQVLWILFSPHTSLLKDPSHKFHEIIKVSFFEIQCFYSLILSFHDHCHKIVLHFHFSNTSLRTIFKSFPLYLLSPSVQKSCLQCSPKISLTSYGLDISIRSSFLN